MQDTWVWSLGQEDPLEEEMATHSSILAWRIPWTEEPGGLQFMGLLKSHTWFSNNTHTHPTSSLSIHLLRDTGCFHILAVVNNVLRTLGYMYPLIYFLLKDNCSTEFCCFLSNLSMNQPLVYIYPLPLETPSYLPPQHVSFYISTFVFFNYMPKRGLAGSYDSSIFSFLKNFYTVF